MHFELAKMLEGFIDSLIISCFHENACTSLTFTLCLWMHHFTTCKLSPWKDLRALHFTSLTLSFFVAAHVEVKLQAKSFTDGCSNQYLVFSMVVNLHNWVSAVTFSSTPSPLDESCDLAHFDSKPLSPFRMPG